MAFSFQVKAVLDEIMGQLPEPFNMVDMMAKAKEKTPYTVVALQECERMNILTKEIRRSLKELDLGLQVHSRQLPASSPSIPKALSALKLRQVQPGSPSLLFPEPTHIPLDVPPLTAGDTTSTFLFLKGRADNYIRDGRAGKRSFLRQCSRILDTLCLSLPLQLGDLVCRPAPADQGEPSVCDSQSLGCLRTLPTSALHYW